MGPVATAVATQAAIHLAPKVLESLQKMYQRVSVLEESTDAAVQIAQDSHSSGNSLLISPQDTGDLTSMLDNYQRMGPGQSLHVLAEIMAQNPGHFPQGSDSHQFAQRLSAMINEINPEAGAELSQQVTPKHESNPQGWDAHAVQATPEGWQMFRDSCDL